MKELLEIIGTICCVYFGMFALESLWQVVVVTPAKIYGAQVATVGELTARNSALQNEMKKPQVSPKEKHRIGTVKEKLESFSVGEKEVIRYILVQGSLTSQTLPHSGLDGNCVGQALRKGTQTGLLVQSSDAPSKRTIDQMMAAYEWRINPDFESALATVLIENAPE